MRIYLVLGGASVSGQAIIGSIHRYHQKNSKNYRILATSSRDIEVDSVHETIKGIDFSRKEASELLLERLSVKVDHFISTLARGRVGLPADKSSPQEIEQACLFSTYPVIYLTERLAPQKFLALSGFVWTPVFLQMYGAMLYAKFYLEEFIFRNPKRGKLLRTAYFHSHSSRAVGLLAQRSFQRNLYPGYELYQFQAPKSPASAPDPMEKSDAFIQYFINRIMSEERELIAKYSKSKESHVQIGPSQIGEGAYQALYGDGEECVVNVAGEMIWEDSKKGNWPKYVYEKEALPPSLSSLPSLAHLLKKK